MIIGIDLDDTLTRLIKGYIKAGEDYCAANGITKPILNKKSNQMNEIFGFNEKELRDVWFNFFLDDLIKMKPRPWARDVMKSFKERGHTIYIITARDANWHVDPYQESFDWLTNKDIPFDKIFLAPHNNKGQICKEQKVDIFLDDFPGNFEDFEGNIHTKKFLMDACHNVDFNRDDIIRVKTWKQFDEYVKKIEKERKN